MRTFLLALLATTLAGAFSERAQAQAYPNKPIRWIVPYTGGGITDVVTRVVTQKMSGPLGQSIVVDNRPGANSILGSDLAAKSPADGYTMLTVIAGYAANVTLYQGKLPFDPRKDLVPVSLAGIAPLIMTANNNLPAKDAKELIALGKAKGGEAVPWGSAGPGTISHLAGELFVSVSGVQFLHVPYKGAGPALTGLLSGETQFAFLSPVTAHVQLQAKKVKAFTVTSLQRFPGTPDIPSATEAGVPGLDALLWFGIMAPAKTPQAIVMKLNREINDSFNRPDVKEALLKLGAIAAPGTPDEMRAFIKNELVKWTPVIKAAGITAQ